jgi:hypothetical protein
LIVKPSLEGKRLKRLYKSKQNGNSENDQRINFRNILS